MMEHPITGLALDLVKARLGISTTIRDNYLRPIVNGIVTELDREKNIKLETGNDYHLMFLVDFASWRYQNRDSPNAMPRHLQFRLHNLMIHNGGVADGDV